MILMLLTLFWAQESDPPSPKPEVAAELEWRKAHEAEMRSDDSWLNLVGLFWLKEGANVFGSRQDLRLSLPPFSTVSEAGVFYLDENGEVRYEMARAQRAMVYSPSKDQTAKDAKPRNRGKLNDDEVLIHNHLRMLVVRRDDRIGLRVRDLRARNFVNFQSLSFYRPKPEYIIKATYIPFDPPKTMRITTVISTELELENPGMIEFEFQGEVRKLTPVLEEDTGKLLVMFQDRTSGSTTYSGGRYLYLDPPEGDTITLNFNRVVNPPCAYTYYATCPLPPAENWMDVAIEAGERNYQIIE